MHGEVLGDHRADDGDAGFPSPASVGRARVELAAYFSGFGIDGRSTGRLAEALLARAAQRWRVRPDRDLVEIAVEEAEADLAAWGSFVLGRERIGEHAAGLVARAAYQACGGGARWPELLLSYDLPAEFVSEMRAAAPPPTPPERPGRMTLQPLETWSLAAALSPRAWNRLIGVLAGGSRA